jgi:DNA-binding NtrC family response regulator
VPVLLHGETGTGTEVYARAIHESSGRPGPFVAVNCGALSPSLLEAELFGHRRGAFSGAIADRPGFIRSADRGTLFLDEIPELSRAGQVALLRVLEEDEVVAVGDTRPVTVDIRIVAASQRPLISEVDAGDFRSDLYARLLGYEAGLPALRERRADLGYIVGNLGRRMTGRSLELTPAAFRALLRYDWPRNVRELERCLATANALSCGGVIDVDHLPPAIARATIRNQTPPPPADSEKDAAMRDQLSAKLAEHRGNITAVARDLGKHREQLQRWIRRLGIDVARFRR